MRKLIQTVSVTAKEEDTTRFFQLEYCVIAKDAYVEGMTTETYGIEILKKEKTKSGTLKVEYRKVFDVFCTQAEAVNCAYLLARNTVTPVSLRDILEQMIGTDSIDCEEYEILAV